MGKRGEKRKEKEGGGGMRGEKEKKWGERLAGVGEGRKEGWMCA